MNIIGKIFPRFKPLVIFMVLTFLSGKVSAQEEFEFVDLGVEFTNTPATVKINGVFGVTARIFLDANSSNIPSSEIISVSVFLRDPNGIILDSHLQSWDGFSQGENGLIAEQGKQQMLFQIPWSQSKNWNSGAEWTVSAELTTSSIDANINNNSATAKFKLDVPDLELSISRVSAVEPLSGLESDNYVPNTNYVVEGTVTNNSNVSTQPGIYIPVTAKLLPVNSSGMIDGEEVDSETVLLPMEDQFETLSPNASWDFKIENLFLPPDASGNYVVSVTVNPNNIPNGAPQIESNYGNNTAFQPDDPYINITSESDANDESARPDLRFVSGSYSGERGSFRGLEPVYLSFAVRNSGNRPVAPDDVISAQILLSKDLIKDSSDFVLREFNLGGDGIGQGLLAGETINLTWFQQMPDNFEGDYYLIISIDNLGIESTSYIDSTPMISLASQDAGTTSILNTSVGGANQPAERPDASEDGRLVTFEKTQTVNGRDLQQIYIIDMGQPDPEPKLISRAYNSSILSPAPANGDSFRPKISADGTAVVFHSSASNLVPGDTNNKEDVFLYRLSTDTMFRAVVTSNNGSTTEQLNGRSLYPDVNRDGSRVVFESDSDLGGNSSGSEIFLWSLNANGVGSLEVITAGNGNSYNPSIDDDGKYVVFDSYAKNLQTLTNAPADTNELRDIFLLDLDQNITWRANLNYMGNETVGGASLNPRISGDGTRIVFESKADNLIDGAGIAKIEVIEGGYGYKGKPTIEVYDDPNAFNSGGTPGSGAILSLKEDGINLLEEIKSDAIIIINPGSGFISPQVKIYPDPAYPAPLQEAKAVAYLSNPDGDVYYVDVADVTGVNAIKSYSKRISVSSSSTGGNFGSRDLSISSDGNAIVYSTKSSNLLSPEIVRDDGKTFYNSNYILPLAKTTLVGGIGEIEINATGSGYTAGTLRIDDLSGTGSGAEASYRVDNRGRIVSIDILNPGQNYRLDHTIVSVSEPRGGNGFSAGTIRFEPTRGEGSTRTGGGRIYKVEMTEYGYGYKIGDDENASFSDIIQFEGDGADLNEDGFPDGRLNPDRVKNIGGSLYLEQQFDIDILSLGVDLINTTLTVSDNNNSLDPLVIKFSLPNSSVTSPTTIIVDASKDRNQIRDDIIDVLLSQLGNNLSGNNDVEVGPVIDNNLTGSTKFRFSALSGTFTSNNPSAVKVTELSNMLVMGSGYTTATPVINQVPNIFGFSETKSNPSFELSEGVGRVALLSEEDTITDDIYLYYVNQGKNHRISTNSFGMPVGYLRNDSSQLTSLSNRFPSISGNGRYVFFSSDAWGQSGLAFSSSNQLPLDPDANRDIYMRDLKTNTSNAPEFELKMLYPKSGIQAFAPNSSIPVIADLNYSSTIKVDRVAMILNQTDRGPMTLFNGGGNLANYNSGRYTAMIPDLESGIYSLQLVAYGIGDQVLATSPLIRFTVNPFEGSLPPNVTMSDPVDFDAITSSSIIPLTARANDPDGAIVAVQYYVDGELYPSPTSLHPDTSIKRVEGIAEEIQAYPTLLDMPSIGAIAEGAGVRSIFVIGWDNSGNYVCSDVYSISFTRGLDLPLVPQISFNSGFLGFDINTSNLDLNFSATTRGLESITSKIGPLGTGLIEARIDVAGSGVGAEVVPVIELDQTSSDYGKIIAFDVIEEGEGYDSNITFKVVPVLRAINTGVEAELQYVYNPPADANQTSRTDSITVDKNVDGSLKLGSGYVIAPRLLLLPYGGVSNWERIPLQETDEPTASIADFGSIDVTLDADSEVYGAITLGGFAQSPIFIEINATSSGEKIESVSLVIDGETSDELTKTEPYKDDLYSFSVIPNNAQDYSISAIVRDVAGNVRSTAESTISIQNYRGGGVNLEVLGDSNFSIESNGQLLLTAMATSQFGISEVEFFINDQSVGVDRGNGGTFFQAFVDINETGLRQGDHTISVVARDKAGNQAGTFPSVLTNISSRKNRTLKVLPPLIKNPPVVIFEKPQTGVTIPLGSSLRLVANASDPNGGLKGVQFYANQDTVYSWSGILEFDGSDLPADGDLLIFDDGSGRGAYTFEFDNNLNVVSGDTPTLVPAYGNYLDDLSLSGGFNYPEALTFVIEIDGVLDGTDTYRWSTDGGHTFVEEKQKIVSGISQTLTHGLSIIFSNKTDHRQGDRWSFVAQPKNQIVNISNTGVPAVDGKRTKLGLFDAMQRLFELGELSIHPQINEYDNSIYLRHINDLSISSSVSVSGNSLSHFNYSSANDNMILASVADSTLPQPFGSTWMPSKKGNYVIFAVAEDFSGNRVSSSAAVVSVLDAEGKVPVIELNSISSPTTYSGSPISQTLSAQGYDPDGTIAMVEFYSNAELVGSDSARPYEVSFELNATGHYELYAIARDNEGNLVTSNVEHLVVDDGGEAPEHALTVDNSEVFVGGTLSVSSNFKSPGGANNYRDDIRALVFINGLYEGDATKMPRTPPLLGQDDPGQSFIFEKEARGVGSYEVEFLILNGNETSSATANITISESPLTDDYLFLKSLWNGLYDRNPVGPEINPFLSGLRNGSISREQVVEKLQYSEEFKTARDLLLVGKTLHGTWRSVPASLEATDQAGYGSMSGGGGNSAAAQAAMGMPYTAADGNVSDLGFYEGVEDDHGNIPSLGSWIDMNSLEVLSIKHIKDDVDYFKIKSANLENEGILEIKLNKAPYGTIVQGGAPQNITAVFYDGSSALISPIETFGGGNTVFFNRKFDLRGLKNVDYYSFEIYPYVNSPGAHLGGRVITTSNLSYVENANFLTNEDIANLEIDSRVNNFNSLQAVAFQANNFSYTNRYGQIETHDPESFFNRLFRNKYEQDPNPTQSARGVNLLKDGRTQLQFLQDFALENNVVTVGGYNYTTSEAQLAIPNVPLDAAAFAETALVYSALMGEAPSNDQVALLTMTPRMEVRPLSQRAELILDMPEYAKQYGVAKPEIDFIGIQNGQTFSGGEQISVEASSLGVDDLGGTVDDGEIHTVELFLNGKSMGLMTEPATGEFFYTHSLASNVTAGEYKLEVVAEDINGLESRAQRMIRVASNKSLSPEIQSPELGSSFEVGETVEVNFSYEGTTTPSKSLLEINGRVQWSEVLSLGSLENPSDEHSFSIDDGTGRGPVFFEFDSNGLASTTVLEAPENIIGTGNLRLGTGEYIGTETREYIVEIDNEPTPTSRTFRWSIDGGVNFNQTEQSVDFSNVSSHPLSSGIAVLFPDSNNAYDLGDRWRIKASPKNEIIEVGNVGTLEDQIEQTRQNMIRAINRARNEGKLAVYAEDPYSKGIYMGSLPERYVLPNSIILHHDASYPVVDDVSIDISNDVPLTSSTCMDPIVSSGTSFSLPLSGCLEMANPLLSLRVISLDGSGHRYYSRENVYQIRNPKDIYAEMLKVGNVFDPGRLPTIQITEVDSNTGAVIHAEILDGGSGYRDLVSGNDDLLAVSTSGKGAELRAEIGSSGTVVDVLSSFKGEKYTVGDTVAPSPPAVFDLGESISLDARLIGLKSQVERVAFYANGVEIQGEVSAMIGGYYSTTFRPSDPGDYFISVRPLYGDSRDNDFFETSTSGRTLSNISLLGNHYRGWQSLWSKQSVSSGSVYTPIWYWQHADYWDPDPSWRARTHWNGAAPVRFVESEAEDIEISLDLTSSALRVQDLFDSQSAQVKAKVIRRGKTSPFLEKAFLYANELLLSEIDVVENDSVKFSISFDWEVSFLELGQSAFLTVVGVDSEGRKYFSDQVTISIREVDERDDPQSAVGMIYSDITGENPSPEEVERLRDLVSNDTTISEVVESILSDQPIILESQIDLIAVQHIIFGEGFENFDDFQSTTEEWLPIMAQDSSDEPLKRFIDSKLSSNRYLSEYRGGIPHLVGPPTSNRLVSYAENRNLFVERHFSIKYGRKPSTLQFKQASRRMLEYWSNNYDAGYWELISSSAQTGQGASFTGLRKDTQESTRAMPFEAGECAVDFIYELAKEFVYPRNQAYLSYISNSALRGSLYRAVALLYTLLREDVDTAEKSVFEQAAELQSLPTDKMVEQITSERRFSRRFNFVFHENSPEVSLLATKTANGFWKSMPWFGTFMDKQYPWIYHVDLGWLYSSGTNTGDIWFYSDSLKIDGKPIGWFWTNKHVYEGPTVSGSQYQNHRFIYVVRRSSNGQRQGSWSLLDLQNGQLIPYSWQSLGK